MKAIFAPQKLVWLFSLLLASCAQIQDSPGDQGQLETLATLPSQVRLYLASGTTNNYLATNAGGKETLKQSCPLQFNSNASSGALLTLSATGSSAKVCHTSTNQLVGVYSSGESSTRKFAVNAGETLSIALGSDTTLKGFYATSATLSVNQTSVATSFDVKFYDGTKLIGTKRFSPTGTGTTPKIFTLAVSGKPFTKVTLVPVQGSFSLKGGRNVIAFTLTSVREYRYRYEYEYLYNRFGSMVSTGYPCGSADLVTGTYEESNSSRDYWSLTRVYRGEVINGNLLRLTYLYNESGEALMTADISTKSLEEVTVGTIRSSGNTFDPQNNYILSNYSYTGWSTRCGQTVVHEPLSSQEWKGTPVSQSLDIPLSELTRTYTSGQKCQSDFYSTCAFTETHGYSVTPK